MPYNPEIYHRRSIRLQGYDYSQIGAYFVTICTYERNCLFGEVVDNDIKLNINGEIAKGCWLSIPRHFPHVELDEFVIMPNHLHGIIIIVHHSHPQTDSLPDIDSQELQHLSPIDNTIKINSHGTKSQSLPAIIQNYKSISTRKINTLNKSKGNSIWQRNYYEHIIRNQETLNNTRQYILNNPINWSEDQENPVNINFC